MESIYIPLSEIQSNPRQPRTEFDAGEMASLVESVKHYGILQPLLVTIADGGIYVLIAGERRLRAAREAGLEEVPVVIVPEASERDQLELALIENVQRVDLNPLEKARAYQQLSDEFHLTHDDIAERVGQHRSTVTNTLRLLKLPEGFQQKLLGGLISERQATALLALYDLPQPLREKAAAYNYDPSLRPSNIQDKVLSGASSDYVRDTINRMLLAFGKNIIWGIDTAFAVPAEMPSLCSECANLIKRGPEALCGDESCYHIRLNAYNKQRLPLPETAPAAVPAPAPIQKQTLQDALSARFTEDTEVDDGDPETEIPPSEPVMEYNTVTAVEPEPEPDAEVAAPQPPPSLVTAPPPAAPDWEHATLLVTITYMPLDGDPDGRPVWVGLRANNSAPAIRMCREKETLLPGWLAGLLLDMETKFKES